MTWSLTDGSGAVRGPATISTPLKSVVLTGTVSGTLNGSTLTWTIDVPAGGVTGQPSCTVTVSGTATLNGARTGLTGSYSGAGSCTPAFSGGTLTLTRQ